MAASRQINFMDTDNFFQSKLFKGIILGISGMIILVFVFGLGVFVGIKKADFSFRWADQYHKNFGGPQGGFFGDMMGQDFTASNGVFGQIVKIVPPAGPGQPTTLVIKGKDNVEKNILVDDKTIIVYQKENIKVSDIQINTSIVVIGEPDNSGQIEAELIRVMPAVVTLFTRFQLIIKHNNYGKKNIRHD